MIKCSTKMSRLSLGKLKDFFTAKRHSIERHWSTHPADRGTSHINLLREFPLYRANMDGNYKTKAKVAGNGIRTLIPLLSQLSSTAGHPLPKPINIKAFAEDEASKTAAHKLEELFNLHGSDKSSLHDYHWLYGMILKESTEAAAILEIGLGSNNIEVPSNMGAEGKPGASLKAWKAFCPNAIIFGADVDTGILFQEERIQTFFVDQTDAKTLAELGSQISQPLDLIIDDGLHSVDANVQTLIFSLVHVKIKGWIVIEDIPEEAQTLWQLIGTLLPADQYNSHLITAKNAMIFAVQRLR